MKKLKARIGEQLSLQVEGEARVGLRLYIKGVEEGGIVDREADFTAAVLRNGIHFPLDIRGEYYFSFELLSPAILSQTPIVVVIRVGEDETRFSITGDNEAPYDIALTVGSLSDSRNQL